MRLRLLIISVIVLLFIHNIAYAVYNREYEEDMIENGNQVATLQNCYKDAYNDSQAYTTVFNSLLQYFSDDYSCTVWNIGLVWEFASKYVSDSETENVLWLGRDNNGRVLEYCFATYDKNTGVFSEITRRTIYKNKIEGST